MGKNAKMKAMRTLVCSLFLATLTVLPGWAAEEKPVLLGVDVLQARGFDILLGKQVGLITNQTGVDSKGVNTADVLAKAPRVKLIALFSPEHGIRGTVEHGRQVGDAIDSRTRLPVYSLYGQTQRPTSEMLNAIDALVFDIQDVGTRYYTYITTMGLAMEEAARRNIEFVVLDRPNPLGGLLTEGPPADASVRHFTAYYSIPIRHGFTVGELAQWYNETAGIKARLTVIPMMGWNRSKLWQDTGLRFIPPSPNIRTPEQALLYSGIGMFEATNLAVGRGTESPFHIIGAPWIKGKNLVKRLNSEGIQGVKFKKVEFTPTKDLYAGQACNGVMIHVTQPKQFRSSDLFVHIAFTLRELYPNDFQLRWPEVARVTGTSDFEKAYEGKQPPSAILEIFQKEAAKFASDREKFLLY
jgi:uncharacterized protein YbbC (DUF1343 family)